LFSRCSVLLFVGGEGAFDDDGKRGLINKTARRSDEKEKLIV